MYTPLKVTTDYTLLKSLIKVKDLIDFCLAKNIKSCSIRRFYTFSYGKQKGLPLNNK